MGISRSFLFMGKSAWNICFGPCYFLAAARFFILQKQTIIIQQVYINYRMKSKKMLLIYFQMLHLKWTVLSHPITTVQNTYTTTIKNRVRKLDSDFFRKF